MVWTGEDSKDVMKKTIGTLLAAALIAVVSKAYDLLTLQMTVLLAAMIAVVFVALILVRLRASTGDSPHADGPRTEDEDGRITESIANAPVSDPSEHRSHNASPPESQPIRHLDDRKARKKAAKGEVKRAKKESKR